MTGEFIFNLIVLFASFLPTYIGVMRSHQQEKAIFVLNAISLVVAYGIPGAGSIPQIEPFPLLGLLGWGVTLLWSFSRRTVMAFESKSP